MADITHWAGIWPVGDIPTDQEVIDGTRAVDWATVTNASDAQISLRFTGLEAETDYAVHWLAEDVEASRVRGQVASFTTEPAPVYTANVSSIRRPLFRDGERVQDHEAKLNPHPQYAAEHPSILMHGAVADFSLDTQAHTITNYPEVLTWGGLGEDDYDNSQGTITIPAGLGGAWAVVLAIRGVQGNNTKDEQIQLGVMLNGAPEVIAIFDVATIKTHERALSGTVVAVLGDGDVLSMYAVATGDLGVFTGVSAVFDIERVH